MGKIESIGIDSSIFHSGMTGISIESNGTYKVVVGGFNVQSANGGFYVHSDIVKEVYAPGSELQKRVASGDVLSEVNHPPFTPGMAIESYIERLMVIEESNVCNVITSLRLDDKPSNIPGVGLPMYLVKATIKLYGPKQHLLKSSLENRHSDTAYSIRGLNYAKEVNGILYKEIHTVNTYDFVKAPGIDVAKKSMWSNLTLESVSRDLSASDLDKILSRLDSRSQVATESENLLINQIKKSIIGCEDGSCIYKTW